MRGLWKCGMAKIAGYVAIILALGFTFGCEPGQTDNNTDPAVSETPANAPVVAQNDLPPTADELAQLPVGPCALAKFHYSYRYDIVAGKYVACGDTNKGEQCYAGETGHGQCYTGVAPATVGGALKADGPNFSSDQMIETSVGECAAPYAVVCASFIGATLDGESFDGTIFCSPHQFGGEWKTVMQPELCPEGSMCLMNGAGLQKGVCQELPECSATLACPATGNICVENVCSNGTCVPTNVGGACSDGNLCTENDACLNGQCKGAPIDCNDGNPCTANDACEDGECVSDNVPAGNECEDGDVCTLGFCDGAGACVSSSKCDDGNPCNGEETCSAAGVCGDGVAINCNDGNPCTMDSCETDSGECVNIAVLDETSCGDEGEACIGGECLADWCKAGDKPECLFETIDGQAMVNVVVCELPDEEATYGTLATTTCGPQGEFWCDFANAKCVQLEACMQDSDCLPDQACQDGACVPICTPQCTDLECGPDGCGGTCGTCGADEACDDGLCEAVCVPACDGTTCGDDGCGGTCACADGLVCVAGLAICAVVACNDDADCVDGQVCTDGV